MSAFVQSAEMETWYLSFVQSAERETWYPSFEQSAERETWYPSFVSSAEWETWYPGCSRVTGLLGYQGNVLELRQELAARCWDWKRLG